MKTKKLKNPATSIFWGILILAMVIPYISSAKKITFSNSTVVPAAKGSVKVKKDDNRNYTFKIVVSDLAEVERVSASKTTYVVWMETDRGNFENLGQLKSSTSFLSKRHKASVEAISSFKPVKIFITAEEGINIQYPDRQIILTTENFRIK